MKCCSCSCRHLSLKSGGSAAETKRINAESRSSSPNFKPAPSNALLPLAWHSEARRTSWWGKRGKKFLYRRWLSIVTKFSTLSLHQSDGSSGDATRFRSDSRAYSTNVTGWKLRGDGDSVPVTRHGDNSALSPLSFGDLQTFFLGASPAISFCPL